MNREGTGFFRVEQENGVWRFITPGGHGFFLSGCNGSSRMQGDPCPALGYSPYTRAMEQTFGKDVARWAADSNVRLKSWGFNAVSTWDDPVPGVITNGIVHARVVLLGRSFAGRAPNSDSNLLDNVTCEGQFPNVFRPDFADHCLKMAQRVCASRREDPRLVGWYTDNEVDWRGAKRTGDATDGAGIYDAVAQLAPEHSGRQALERFLAERGLKVADPVPLAVKQDFLRLVAREYYRVTTSAIRAADPNHLVLGCRFAGFLSAPDIAWEEGGKWNDVMTVNAYPPVDLEEGVVRAHWKDRRPIREKLRDVYALCFFDGLAIAQTDYDWKKHVVIRYAALKDALVKDPNGRQQFAKLNSAVATHPVIRDALEDQVAYAGSMGVNAMLQFDYVWFSRDGVWGFDEASAAAFRAFLAKVKADRELTKAFFR